MSALHLGTDTKDKHIDTWNKGLIPFKLAMVHLVYLLW